MHQQCLTLVRSCCHVPLALRLTLPSVLLLLLQMKLQGRMPVVETPWTAVRIVQLAPGLLLRQALVQSVPGQLRLQWAAVKRWT